MTDEVALEFLRRHQPMPDDSILDQEILDHYDEVRKYFLIHHNLACIPIFLNSFGEGTAFGIYQLVEGVIRLFPSDVLIPHIEQALMSRHSSVRFWTTEIAALFPCSKLIDPLEHMLHDDSLDIRIDAAFAHGLIEDSRTLPILEQTLQRENDPEFVKDLTEAIALKKEQYL